MTTMLLAAQGVGDPFAGAAGHRLDPPTLLPASVMIELAGEEVRAGLCIFTDGAGQEWCLRSDLTVPIALMVAAGRATPGRYVCAGPVYGLPPTGRREPIERSQAGFEWFGGGGPEEDAEAAALALEAFARLNPDASACVFRFGDVDLFGALLDALDMTPSLRRRIGRAYGRGEVLDALANSSRIEAGEGGEPGAGALLASTLSGLSHDEAAKVVEDMLAIAGVSLVGGRPASEIAERLRERARSDDLAPHVRAVIADYLALRLPAAEARDAIDAVCRRHGLRLDPARWARFDARMQRLSALRPSGWERALFRADPCARYGYYDGFVFDLAAPTGAVVVSGGRYDGLVRRLGGSAEGVPAIGASRALDPREAWGAHA